MSHGSEDTDGDLLSFPYWVSGRSTAISVLSLSLSRQYDSSRMTHPVLGERAEYRHQCILELAKPQNKDVGVWECGRGGEDRVVRRTGYSDQGNIAVRPPFKDDIFAGEDTALLKQMSAGNSTSFSTVFAFTVPGRGYTNSSLCICFPRKQYKRRHHCKRREWKGKGVIMAYGNMVICEKSN